MTIVLSFVTVTNSIAALSISGVTILKVDEIPQSASLITPVMFPRPNNPITDILPTRKSFGTGGNEKTDFEYTLHYVFYLAELGSGVGQMEPLSPLLIKLDLILETIMNNDVVTGLVDMQLNDIEAIGPIQDPSGANYWGAVIGIRCKEFAN